MADEVVVPGSVFEEAGKTIIVTTDAQIAIARFAPTVLPARSTAIIPSLPRAPFVARYLLTNVPVGTADFQLKDSAGEYIQIKGVTFADCLGARLVRDQPVGVGEQLMLMIAANYGDVAFEGYVIGAEPAYPDQPIPMIMSCPQCDARHVDKGEFATKPHHTHACQECGFTWRPAVVPTVGVRFLPGFKDP